MDGGMGTVYRSDSNKGLISKFLEDYRVRPKAPQGHRRLQWFKRCEYSSQDEYISPL